jgi:hypothetical protein
VQREHDRRPDTRQNRLALLAALQTICRYQEELTMLRTAAKRCGAVYLLLVACAAEVCAQKAPYDVFPPAEAPYYRVRYEASDRPGDLICGVNYTVWVPPGVKTLRGVIVHQHGCGEGSCKSGLTGAYNLHWQALARKHDCALLSPAYEQPEKADCQMWCDPRNGSDAGFQKCLAPLGAKSGHPELWRRCRGRCGGTAAAATGPAGW